MVDDAADHHRDQLGLAGLGHGLGGHVLAVAQHGDAVGEGEDLGHAVADVDHADPAGAQVAHDREQPQHVGLGQGRGRLVHDQHAGVERERLGDLDPLPVGDRERAHRRGDVELVDLERGQDLGGAGAHGGPVHAAPTVARGVAQEDVLGHAQIGEQQQFLEHRGDAGGLRLLRSGEVDLVPIDADRARIRAIDARDDLDQRRLAGAVLAEQRVDLAGMDVEADVVKRPHAGERLAQALDLEYRPIRFRARGAGLHRASLERGSRSGDGPSMSVGSV